MDLLRTLFGDEGDILKDRQFQLLNSTVFVLALGNAIISPILETLTGPFAVSSATIGQLIAAYSLPGIFLIPVMGYFADTYGRKPLIVTGLILFGIGGTAIAFTTDFNVALALRLLQGIGWAAVAPVVITAIGDLYSGDREATAQGIQFTTIGMSQTVIPPIAGFIAIVGWQYPIVLYVVSIPIAVTIWFVFEEPTAIGSSHTADDEDTTPASHRGHLRALTALVTNSGVVSVIVARQIPTFTWFAIITYTSIIVVQVLGGTTGMAGVLLAVASVSKAVGSTQVGRATAYFSHRITLLLVVNSLLAIGLVIAGFAPNFVMMGFGFTVTGLAQGLSLPLYQSVITGFAPQHLRGSVVSVSETLGRVTATLTPLVMGAIIVFLTPAIGSELSIRWTVAGAGLLAAVLGTVVLSITIRSPPVLLEHTPE